MKKTITTLVLVSGLAITSYALDAASGSTAVSQSGTVTSAEMQSAIQSTADVQLSTRVEKEIKSQFKNFDSDRQLVFSNGGEVTLEGRVNTRAEYDRIEKAARRVKGVAGVQNNLIIESATQGSGSRY